MKTFSHFTEGLLTATQKELEKVRGWLTSNDFSADPIKRDYLDPEKNEKLDLAFVASYDGKKSFLKSAILTVAIKTSSYSNRKVFIVRYKQNDGYELYSANEVIDNIKKYYKIK